MNVPPILGKVPVLIIASAIAAKASDSFSDADKVFVAKVSQGGMYEVELGKLAQTKGGTQDIKDQGNTEAHPKYTLCRQTNAQILVRLF
jgi:hypothetical protein